MSPLAAMKQKKKRIRAVQQKLRVFRAKEPLLSVLMWGVNYSINELGHVTIPVMLMPDDFKSYIKIRIDNHLFNKDNMPSHFKFKEWCPLVFRNLRERFGIDEESYLLSLTKHCPLELDSPGRSGARFLVSYDRKFIVKTLASEEVTEMHRILKDYHQYVVERHADTLLPQYLGMYRLTVNDTETYLVVMRNIFSSRLVIHKKYDLKGSTVDRQASDKERAKDLPTFKDNDFVNDGISLPLEPDQRIKLINTLEADTGFLANLNLMDYSLLVGIHDCDRPDPQVNDPFDSEENGVDDEDPEENVNSGAAAAPTPPDSPMGNYERQMSADEFDPKLEAFAVKCGDQCGKQEIYFMALIDILTHYGVKKRTAQAAKTVKHGSGAEISTVKPDQYARRFMEFIDKVIK